MSQAEISEIVGCSQPYVNKVINAYQLCGDSIFTESCKNNGTKPCLSTADLEKLSDLLQKPSSEYGYEGDLWTKHRIADMIQKYFKLSYHPNSIFRIMKKINFSSQKPILKDYRQNASKVEEFKTQKMSELKKKRQMSNEK